METEPDARVLEPAVAPTPTQRVKAYSVHVFTATGVVFAFLAAAEITKADCDPRWVFIYLAIQCLIDAADGPLARAWQVKKYAARIDGRTIDDIIDYMTYTFIPLLLVWRMDWLPGTDALWVCPALIASLFGFSNTGAKDEKGGFFLGFPSYWNIVALYVGAWHASVGPWPGAILVAACTILTVLPVRFLYPNLAPRPWKWPTLIGAGIWTILVAAMLPNYPHVPAWLMIVSLIYPVAYISLSLWLDLKARHVNAPV
ncbi:MAG TPA: hypothetical protein VGB55_06515 [Tepidisphaeraceae bacterium]